MTDCDHIIGFIHDYDNSDIVTLDDLKQHVADAKYRYDHFFCNKYFTLSDYTDKRVSTDMTRFNYCPMCGEKIDWKLLKGVTPNDR